MSCEEIERTLTGFHFGVVSEEERAVVEAHLPGCPACVRAFVEIKRAIETAEAVAAPSELARRRLRLAVQRELEPPEALWPWWQQPVVFAFAGAAVVLAMVTTRAVVDRPGAPPYGMSVAR
jgi:anti-sigma factor RsiW